MAGEWTPAGREARGSLRLSEPAPMADALLVLRRGTARGVVRAVPLHRWRRRAGQPAAQSTQGGGERWKGVCARAGGAERDEVRRAPG